MCMLQYVLPARTQEQVYRVGEGCWRGGPGKYVVTIDSFRNTQEAGTLHSSVEPGSSAVQCTRHHSATSFMHLKFITR